MKSKVSIFVVNLQRDHEKKSHMISVAENLGVKFDYIDAVYGKDLSQGEVDNVYDESLSQKVLGRGLSRGELGCALSHLSIYQKMVDEQVETALVLEDDVDISSEIHDVFNALQSFPEDWEVMLLGYYSDTATERVSMSSLWGKSAVTSSHQAVRLVEVAFGTHGYLINLRGAKRMLNTLDKVVKPIDHYTGSGRYINMYGLAPRVITLNDKFKEMGCIEVDRTNEHESTMNKHFIKIFFRQLWDSLRKVPIIYWVKKFPSRLLSLKKYND